MQTHEHYMGRREDLRAATARMDDDPDEGHEALDTLALSIERETVYRIVLGTGGPHDEVRVRVSEHGEIIGGTYAYYWRGQEGHGEFELTPGEAEEWAEAFGIGEVV